MFLMNLEDISIQLFEIGVIKFGEFVLKSGLVSPVYIDLRILIGHPLLLKKISQTIYLNIIKDKIKFDCICGVPYTALPFATSISLDYAIPMIFKRSEVKKYGTKKLIEGIYEKGQNCLIIEDVVTTGISILETAQALIENGLNVKDVVFVIDREGSGTQNLISKGLRPHRLLTISQIMDTLLKQNKITPEVCETYNIMINKNLKSGEIKRVPFLEREQLTNNVVTKKLIKIMENKSTNLIFSADIKNSSKLLDMVDLVGPHVCCIKTHIDILQDFSPSFIQKIQSLAKKHSFLIMEDRKFADIGYILKCQYEGGMYKISEWADIVTTHALVGKWAIEALKQACVDKKERGCIIVAEMSGQDSHFTPEYTEGACKLAESYKDFVVGLVCQKRLSNDPALLHFTPGIKLLCNGADGEKRSDELGQSYNSPEQAILKGGTDVVIVGRDIYEAKDPLQAVKALQNASWNAYQKSLSGH